MGFLLATGLGADQETNEEFKRGVELFLAIRGQNAPFQIQTISSNNTGDSLGRDLSAHIRKGVKIFVGLARSDQVLGISPILNDTDSIFLSVLATNPAVLSVSQNLFSMASNDVLIGSALAKFVREELKGKRLAVLINRESIYSQGLAKSFTNALKKEDITTFSLEYDKKDLKIQASMPRLKNYDPQIVFIPDYADNAALLSKAILEQNLSPVFIGGDGWGGKRIFHAIQQQKPAFRAYYAHHWDQASASTPLGITFTKEYKKRFNNAEPTTGSALIFEAFCLLEASIPDNDKLDVAVVRSNLKSKRTLGTMGWLSFRPTDNAIFRDLLIVGMKDARYVVEKVIKAGE